MPDFTSLEDKATCDSSKRLFLKFKMTDSNLGNARQTTTFIKVRNRPSIKLIDNPLFSNGCSLYILIVKQNLLK